MNAGPQQFNLAYRGNTVWLPPGQLYLGRSVACHIVIDDPMVSRRHAQMTVTTRHVTVEDLNSINGVYVNGKRLAGGPLVLRPNDRIQLGSEELVFGTGPRNADGTARATATISGLDPVVPAGDAETGAGSEARADFGAAEQTCKVDALALVGEAADRALAEGNIAHAEQMLSSYLTDVLNSARHGKSVLNETVINAMRCGLKLAWATRNGAWFDYVIELLYARRVPPPDEYMESLYATLEQVGSVDLARLRRYVASLPQAVAAPTPNQQRQLAHASALLQAAERKQGEIAR
jgi:hypothetical protein